MHIDICLIPVVLTVALNNSWATKGMQSLYSYEQFFKIFLRMEMPNKYITMKSSRYKKGLNVRTYVEDFEIIFNSGFYSFIVPIFLI